MADVPEKEQVIKEGILPPAPVDIEVKKNREFQLLKGHPWIYREALRDLPSGVTPGTVARVITHRGVFLGLGLIDPTAFIPVRLFSGPSGQSWEEMLSQHIRAAIGRRESWFHPKETNAYRLINGEGDGLPGLIVDRYDRTLVAAIYTISWEPWLGQVANLLLAAMPHIDRILLRQPTSGNRVQKTQLLHGRPGPAKVRILENGLTYQADLEQGQKTGFFLDQRDNRALVRTLSKGRRVANICGYTGGFSVAAAAGGANRTLTIDSAAPALEEARSNLELNGFAGENHRCHCLDMYQWLEEPANRGTFDLIVLDPPSMTRNKSDRIKALRAYSRLNALAAACLQPGGLLFTASCSSQITRDDFLEAIREGVSKAKRQALIIQETAHAADHPIALAHPEGRYLKGFLLEVTT